LATRPLSIRLCVVKALEGVAMFKGDAVRDLRQALGWSREELGAYLGVPEQGIASWEDGDAQPANEQLGALYRLAAANRLSFEPFRAVGPAVEGSADPFTEPRLSRVRMLVETRYMEPISLAQAARAACLEPKYFSKFFRKKVGYPFSAWLAGFRTEKATELLLKTKQPVTTIGYAVGFQSIRTFERTFKRFTGCCPGEYRMKRRPLPRTKTSGDET